MPRSFNSATYLPLALRLAIACAYIGLGIAGFSHLRIFTENGISATLGMLFCSFAILYGFFRAWRAKQVWDEDASDNQE